VTVFGQLTLLFAFIAAGYSVFACAVGWRFDHRLLKRSGHVAGFASVGALSVILVILVNAFAKNDFCFAYVAQYSSRNLPWHYAISALWVGQAGSLLLWSWCLGAVALVYRFWPGKQPDSTSDVSFAVLMTYLFFLVIVMVFGADPMEPSLSIPTEGAGMSPSLQHPVMLIHPPVIFLGYAIWAVPFAVALSALLTGQIDCLWFDRARRWILCAWVVLGLGILLGAKWAYEELGWGGYWNWDPVENGSLMPWLAGTALIHCGLAWHYRGLLKKTALLLALITFALCNFAAFLTRSGIFGSLHEFSQSPIGWLFLLLMALLTIAAVVLVPMRRKLLCADNQISGIASREAFLVIAAVGWLGLTLVVFLGTLATPLSGVLMGKKLTVGPEFYNNAMLPVGVVLLITTASAPLLCWGSSIKPVARKALWIALGVAVLSVVIAFSLGMRRIMALTVTGSAVFAAAVVIAAVFVDSLSISPSATSQWKKIFSVFGVYRRRYAGFAIHLGFVAIAVGITASALGTQRWETSMRQGETVSWAGRSIRFTELRQQRFEDKLVIQSDLEISGSWRGQITLLPAQYLYLQQNQWATKVAIDSALSGDLYVILNRGRGEEQIEVTFVEKPLICWIWYGGALICLGSVVALWPVRIKVMAHNSSAEKRRMEIHEATAGVPCPQALHKRHKNMVHDADRD
jgi:cytochrome c-type biogenesis protein CcmF